MTKTKQELRRSHKEKMSEISVFEYQEKSERLSLNLESLLTRLSTIQNKFILGVYSPLKDEPLWNFKLNAYEDNLAFPSTDDNGAMIFIKCRFEELIETTEFGVKLMAPKLGGEVITPNILVVPGLAFSQKGERLGRGKGYYDKYLKNFLGIKIGICFEDMVVNNLPTELHDIDMDYVVTDGKIR